MNNKTQIDNITLAHMLTAHIQANDNLDDEAKHYEVRRVIRKTIQQQGETIQL